MALRAAIVRAILFYDRDADVERLMKPEAEHAKSTSQLRTVTATKGLSKFEVNGRQ